MKIKWDKKNYKWVYNAGVKPQASTAYSQNTHKAGKKKSKWMIFLMALVAVLLVFTVMISVLDIRACPHFDLHQIKMHAKRNMAL